jgi:hypothetical protein
MTADQVITSFSNLAKGAKDLFSAAGVRRIIVRNTENSIIIQAPLTVAVIVTIVALPIVAAGAVTALVLRYTLSIEQKTTDRQDQLERRRQKRAV